MLGASRARGLAGSVTALKLGGAAYLAWLGLQALLAARRGDLVTASGMQVDRLTAARAFAVASRAT